MTFYDKPRPLPELHFTNADGHKLSVADFRGRMVLLNIWATWCVPCRKEMPALDRLETKLGGPDFEVVALSIDRQGLAAVQPFFKEFRLKALHIYLDQSGKAAVALNVPGIPTTLLIDHDGREIARKIGPAEWDSPKVLQVLDQHMKLRGAIAE
jgi:thiol-disulfide isomerase/thioredoxin